MKISSPKSEAMVVCGKMMSCSLWVGSELLTKVVEFEYFGVLPISDGELEREIDRHIGPQAVPQAWSRTVTVKNDSNDKLGSKVSNPHPWSWALIEAERRRLQTQSTEMVVCSMWCLGSLL